MGKTKKKRKVNKRNRHIGGKIFAWAQIILSLIFVVTLLMLNILPVKYLIVIFGILIFMGAFSLVSQYTKSAHIIGKVDCAIMCLLLLFGNIYVIRANTTLFNITNNKYKVDRIAIAVRVDDPAETLEEAASYYFGIQSIQGSDKVEQAVEQIETNLGGGITHDYYEDPYQMVQDLYDKKVDAIIYNTAYEAAFLEHFPNFKQDIRELKNIEIKTEIDPLLIGENDTKVTQTPFTVYVSGIDTEGSISTTSRSDVNMFVTVNPVTKQVLMTSVPRDYYVPLPGVSEGQRDKLTHAGLYGVQCSMDTLGALFGVDVDFYARVNFTTLRAIVDALGGIDVNSRYDFTTISGEHFVEGMNYNLNGSTALAFARERYNLPNGDNDRIIDQQIVMEAIIQKCMSPAILTGYMGIMESLSNSFETSFSQKQIASLVRMQLNDGAKWNIMSSHVKGFDSEDTCYSSGDTVLYVMEPDYGNVEAVSELIKRVKAGEILTPEDLNAAMEATGEGTRNYSEEEETEDSYSEEYTDDYSSDDSEDYSGDYSGSYDETDEDPYGGSDDSYTSDYDDSSYSDDSSNELQPDYY